MNRALFAFVNLLVVISRLDGAMTPQAFDNFFASLRRQTPAVYAIARAGRPMHLNVGGVLALLGWFSGTPTWVCLTFFGIVVALEIWTSWGQRRLPANVEDVTTAQAVSLLTICLTSSSLFMLAGLNLTMIGDQAHLVLGMIVSFGIISHVTTTYGPFPAFNMPQLAPNVAILYAQVYEIRAMDFATSPAGPWVLTAAGLAVFTVNLFETRRKTHRTFLELRTAQRDANIRLKELEHYSHHDPLTGLLNRRAFDMRIQQRARGASGLQGMAICVLDLDAFKPINDSYSHEAGDAVLREVAARIANALGPDDIAARAGGDEFVIAVSGITSVLEAKARAQSILSELAPPVLWNGKPLSLSASMGVSLANQTDGNIAKLISEADQAMYRAKQHINDGPQVYNEEDFAPRPTLQDRAALMRALRNREFKPYYQPKIDLRTGMVIGFEALARWEQPTGQLRFPGAFLRQIEELGLQGEFVTTITVQVLRDVSHWVEAGIDPGQISINLPEVSLATQTGRNDLLSLINTFPETRKHITFEITEDVFIARAGEYIRDTIRQLRAAGIRIALDDFGTGFASFRHLRELEFDELKIDTSFVADLGADESSDVLVEGLISIARGLDVAIIAEGVECVDQRDTLIDMGCVFAQGFLWDAALPADNVPLRLMAQPHRLDHASPPREAARSSAG